MSLITAEDFAELAIKFDLNTMSNEIFQVPYSTIKSIIYPNPPYKTFLIAKRNGSSYRVINEPKNQLKALQEKLLTYLYKKSGKPKPCVHGFTPQRSILTNAEQHCSPKTHHILNIDIEDFFPSINFYRIRGLFKSRPFDFSHNVATVLAHLCCYKNSLPQGAPTSPLLANLICRGLDKELMALAHRHKAIYTRYSDDITFSFSAKQASRLPPNICSFDSGVLTLGDEIQNIFKQNSFSINPSKSRLSNPRHRLEVTGLVINEFPNVKRIFIDQVRGALHAWEKFGYQNAVDKFRSNPYKRRTRTGSYPSLNNYLKGKLLFIKMVRGLDDIIYTKLADKYNTLNLNTSKADPNFILNILPVALIVRNREEAERAVFVVECSGDHPTKGPVFSQGTAFYIGDLGFITCEHVIRNDSDYFDDLSNYEITLLDPKTKEKWHTKVAHRDATYDLAILEVVDSTKPSCRYFSCLDSAISNLQGGFIIGFPNYSPGKKAPIHIKTEILSNFNRHALARIEVGEQIRMGNSGGPFVDELYRLAGVIQQGATIESSNNECLSVHEMQKWLEAFKKSKIEHSQKIALLCKLHKLLIDRLSAISIK